MPLGPEVVLHHLCAHFCWMCVIEAIYTFPGMKRVQRQTTAQSSLVFSGLQGFYSSF